MIEEDIARARERCDTLPDDDSRRLLAGSYLRDAESFVIQARDYVRRALAEIEAPSDEFQDDGVVHLSGEVRSAQEDIHVEGEVGLRQTPVSVRVETGGWNG
jgi:hypothetical protein